MIDSSQSGKDKVVARAALSNIKDKTVEITLKASAPTLDKQIKHNENGIWGVVGDNQIGDKVEYRLITRVPDTTGYNEYTYIIHDKMTEGLTFNEDSVEIYVGEEKNKKNKLDKNYYEVKTVNSEDETFNISIKILDGIKENKFKAEEKLYIYYTATLNEKALIAKDSNDNTAYLEYSNNPYDQPNYQPENENNGSVDKTPEITVKDYTFQLNIDKVDDNDQPLGKVEFSLSRDGNEIYFNKVEGDEAKYIVCAEKHDHGQKQANCKKDLITAENGKLQIIGLDDNVEYTLKETKTLDGYTGINPIKFKITANYDGSQITTIITDNEHIKTPEGGFILETKVVNIKGQKLPETGGIGTKIFTVVGLGLMIVSGGALYIRRRTN